MSSIPAIDFAVLSLSQACSLRPSSFGFALAAVDPAPAGGPENATPRGSLEARFLAFYD